MGSLIGRVVGKVESGIIRLLKLKNRYPPLFILGAPRSGTTLVYQYVVNSFRCSYFPNLSKWHPNACVTAAAVSKLLYRYEAAYESSYGIAKGKLAPSDGWDIFHRWFPRYDYSEPVRTDYLHELRTIVRLLEVIFGGPFFNKNNSNSTRIAYLDRVFPDALFVHVHRNTADAAYSLVRARQEHGIPLNQWWGVAPPNFHALQFHSELEQATAQIWDVKRCIREGLSFIPSDRVFSVSYRHFCEHPPALRNWIESAYLARGHRIELDGSQPSSFECSTPRPVEQDGHRAAVDRMVSLLESESRPHTE